MTIFNKHVLNAACEVARGESDPALGSVLLEPDGSVAVMNKWAIVAASPVSPEARKALPFEDEALPDPAAFPASQLQALAKAIPADKQFKGRLEHASVTSEGGNVFRARCHDGRGLRDSALRAVAAHPALLSWRQRFRDLGAPKPGEFVFNRARLSTVVATIDALCRYDGEFDLVEQKVWERGYVWRAMNSQTRQVVMAAWILPTIGAKPIATAWESEIFGQPRPKNVLVRRRP